MPGNREIAAPFQTHVVVGDDQALRGAPAKRLGGFHPQKSWRLLQGFRQRHISRQHFPGSRVYRIEHGLSIDGVAAQDGKPAVLIDRQRRVADRQKIDDPQTVTENMQRRGDGFVGFRGIEIINAAGGEMFLRQAEKIGG